MAANDDAASNYTIIQGPESSPGLHLEGDHYRLIMSISTPQQSCLMFWKNKDNQSYTYEVAVCLDLYTKMLLEQKLGKTLIPPLFSRAPGLVLPTDSRAEPDHPARLNVNVNKRVGERVLFVASDLQVPSLSVAASALDSYDDLRKYADRHNNTLTFAPSRLSRQKTRFAFDPTETWKP